MLQRTNHLQKVQSNHFNPWQLGILGSVIFSIALCGCSSYVINPAGQTAATGTLVASPSSLSFGAVKVGHTSSATVTFLNKGSVPVQVSKFALNAKPFSASSDNQLPFTLSPGAEFHIAVQFKPVAKGSTAARLTITSDSTSDPNEDVDLSGSGTDATSSAVHGLTCTESSLSGSGTDTCTVTLDSAAPSAGLSVALSSNSGAVKVPSTVTVAANSTSAKFNATVSAVPSSETVKLTAEGGGATSTFDLQLKPESESKGPSVSALSCADSTMSTSGTDACKVTLDAKAPSGGLKIELSSSSGAVTVPGSVTVGAAATSATFSASVFDVTSDETVKLTADEGGHSATFDIELKPSGGETPASGPALTFSATAIAFGDVVVNSPATQSLTLKSTGTSPVTISAVTLAGSGFKVEGPTLPLTLDSQQSTTLNVEFDPTATGTVQGQLTISSSSSNDPVDVVTLTGTGVSHRVELNWNAPANSPVSIQGYHIYRNSNGGSTYQLINQTIDQNTTYVDGSVQSGQTYEYEVKAVDTNGMESPPSNTTSVTIP
ncbi:MAG TPA: choice-of-anchor D domain-containing protein [Terracidiphilus sp.]|nr:choice-of-anchor D domain-containing protein [Terracidiphilus sp.]